MPINVNRRDLIKVGALGSAAVALPLQRAASTGAPKRMPESRLPAPFTQQFRRPPVKQAALRSETTDYYSFTMREGIADILPGYKTMVWGYDGVSPGPTIVARRGRPVVARFINELPATHPTLGYENWTSVHLHGSASLPQYDGYASDITRRGEYKDYRYPNFQNGRLLWYHDHGIHHTAENAYFGLAGGYLLTDELEDSLPIPKGEYDVPLVITDKIFDEAGQLLYLDNSHSSLHGDVILVNGVAWPAMKVHRRKYRFRVLNASVSRGFNLRLSTGEPVTMIGTDAGLMPRPQTTSSFRLASGERYEFVIDFAKYAPGQRIILQNLGVKNSVDYINTDKVMAFDVQDTAGDPSNNTIPAVLNPAAPAMDLVPNASMKVRRFEFIRHNGLWTVNGRTWKDVEASNYELVWADPTLGDTEIWEFVNKSGGWFHPIHVHLVDYKILSRNGAAPFPYELGGKDTLYLGENETVRVIAQFGPHTGKWMIHCHNIVHEDHDMMAQFVVRPRPGAGGGGAGAGGVGAGGVGATDPNHPIYADPPRAISAMPALGTVV